MSDFESAALGWYWENASGWAAKVGITASEFRALRLKGFARTVFLRIMSKIEQAYDEMRAREADRIKQ